MNDLTTIREALKYSFHLGVHSDLGWFTDLQFRALKALAEIENGNGHTEATHVDMACPWPLGECEE
jgi:hypothetical protein